ncbi:MAG TPA: nucleotidyl transferase AbiEii/AbiGii toxin family protein [Ilumatobacter sp.]|nr:nucleotidyl transferase AbiEii/AbiGii toxin family protein [Ilumatobacter sp.]
MSGPPIRDKPPHNANVLGRWLTESANHSGIAAGRLRRWLGFMIVAAMLDQARHRDDGEPLFLIKGGVAMELRIGGSARATRDLDAALRAAIGELAEHLDPALRTGFGDFGATRTELQPIRDTGAIRCDIKISYRHKPVVTVPVEVAEVEASMGAEVDRVRARPLSDLGIAGPESVPCIAVRWQIAQKLHACTERIDDVSNDRFRDLLDLQLLADLVDGLAWQAVRVACVEVFQGRDSHPWPPTLTIPDDWVDGYRTLALDANFTVIDVEHAAAAVRTMIDRIDQASRD